MNAGDAFIPSHPYDHLYVVVSDPALDSDNIVLLNFTSYEPEEEDCCIANAGEHQRITKRSCIRYKDGRVSSVAHINKLIETGTMRRQKSVTLGLLERIREGASKSDFLPEGCRRVLEDQGLL